MNKLLSAINQRIRLPVKFFKRIFQEFSILKMDIIRFEISRNFERWLNIDLFLASTGQLQDTEQQIRVPINKFGKKGVIVDVVNAIDSKCEISWKRLF